MTPIPIAQLKPSDIGRVVTATHGEGGQRVTVVGHLDGYRIVTTWGAMEDSVMISGKEWVGCLLSWTPDEIFPWMLERGPESDDEGANR